MPEHQLKILTERGETDIGHVKRLPDHCPQCHHSMEPQFLTGFRLTTSGETRSRYDLQAVFVCPRYDCRRIFIGYYTAPTGSHSSEGIYELQGIAPEKFSSLDFPEKVRELSPTFVEIFNQAAHAEALKLLLIAGPGYRKALEFLIKDFLISQEPDKEDAIKRMSLQNAISNKVSDANVKTCAQRAAWLGNDETHYERVWQDRDLQDLKRLITLTVNWIENTLLTREYEAEMEKA